MKKILALIKSVALLGAIALLAWSAAPGSSSAGVTTCEGKGDTCAVVKGDQTTWYKHLE